MHTIHPLEWHRARKRPDHQHVMAVHGFGNGDITLWLPPCEADAGIEPISRTPPSWMDAELRAGRAELLRVYAKGSAVELLGLQALLLTYAAGVVNAAYQAPGSNGEPLSDADLTFILCSSDKWYSGMIRHSLGFRDSIDVLKAVGILSPKASITHVPPAPSAV